MDISPAHSAFYFTESFFVTSHESKKETAKMIPHLAVSLLLTLLIPYTRGSLLLQDRFPA